MRVLKLDRWYSEHAVCGWRAAPGSGEGEGEPEGWIEGEQAPFDPAIEDIPF
jgi:hypothetical protein